MIRKRHQNLEVTEYWIDQNMDSNYININQQIYTENEKDISEQNYKFN